MMNANFSQEVTLIGVVGKKGEGVMDGGQTWKTDRVELHVLQAFDTADQMAYGQTVVVHQIQNYDKHYNDASKLVGHKIEIQFKISASKKPGQAPRVDSVSFSGIQKQKTA